MQFESQQYDLSTTGQSDNFNLYVNSNFSLSGFNRFKGYNLNIYFSEKFVPVDGALDDQGNYTILRLSLNASLNSGNFRFWFWNYNYIELITKTKQR